MNAQENGRTENGRDATLGGGAQGGARPDTAEHRRLAESDRPTSPWRAWGPYLAGRQWGTVREDYSERGDAWEFFPFEHAHARAYRWGEDGLAGISDVTGRLNFAVALWNRRDPILKERLYGLTNGQGNHGEDVKEYWWPTDGTPTHSHMELLYRYPQAEFPYAQLRDVNAARSREEREYELGDTGVLAENRFFDVRVRYAKAGPHDIRILITATNCGPDAADLDILPTLWWTNTWSWGYSEARPSIAEATDTRQASGRVGRPCLLADPGATVLPSGSDGDAHLGLETHPALGPRWLVADGSPETLICDNDTNEEACFGTPTKAAYTKDGVGRRVIAGETGAVKPAGEAGTKAALWYRFDQVLPGASATIRLRLTDVAPGEDALADHADVIAAREREADEFYAAVIPPGASADEKLVARRAFAGLLWGKQLYRYDVPSWLAGDPVLPAAPARAQAWARNTSWRHMDVADVISMPDEWEYPWFAAWDLAFHAVTLAHVDPAFAKHQLVLMCREWVMHPDGQLPAYEWAFGDVNPPVHAWAAWLVYLIDGARDRDFLQRVFAKLLLNFSWWVNRKDADGSNLFEGGFMGMDNIGLFNRSAPLPEGFRLEQSDATSWMAFYCHQMLQIALELSRTDDAWNDIATKFLEHFSQIAAAVRSFGSGGVELWDSEDGFFYDVLVHPDGTGQRLRAPSMVGLLPLLGVTRLPAWIGADSADLASRLEWLARRRPERIADLVEYRDGSGGIDALLTLLSRDQLADVLGRLFDEDQFYSPYGIRSLSKAVHDVGAMDATGQWVSISYEPGESAQPMFGGNSNWRGPVWLPVNVLLTNKLRMYGRFHGDDLLVEVPAGSGRRITLLQAAEEVEDRLISLFLPADGRRPSDGARIEASDDPAWSAHPTFSEYFDGDTGEGLGATHQTGWTALVAHLIVRRGLDLRDRI